MVMVGGPVPASQSTHAREGMRRGIETGRCIGGMRVKRVSPSRSRAHLLQGQVLILVVRERRLSLAILRLCGSGVSTLCWGVGGVDVGFGGGCLSAAGCVLRGSRRGLYRFRGKSGTVAFRCWFDSARAANSACLCLTLAALSAPPKSLNPKSLNPKSHWSSRCFRAASDLPLLLRL